MACSVFKESEQAAIRSRLAVTPKKVEKEQPKQIVASHPPIHSFERMREGIKPVTDFSVSVIRADRNLEIAKNVDSTKANYELHRKFSRFVASVLG